MTGQPLKEGPRQRDVLELSRFTMNRKCGWVRHWKLLATQQSEWHLQLSCCQQVSFCVWLASGFASANTKTANFVSLIPSRSAGRM
jgi:hypothetical protein